jgi:DNA-binding transcriptional LysR family regulator
MERWDDLRLLLVLHRERSLARAAKALDVDATTVGRRLSALEARLGVRLVVRHRGSVAFTRAAAGVVEELQRAEEAITRAGERARSAHGEVEGVVRLASTEQLASLLVAPRLGELLVAHPRLQLDLRVAPEVSAVGRDVDVALRIAPPRGEALRLRRAGELGFAFYRPRQVRAPDDALLLFSPSVEQREERETRRSVARGARVQLTSTSSGVLREAALAGLGTALLPCLLGDADGRLVRVPRGPPVRRPLWVVVHRDEAPAARVRAVADWLVRVCRAERARLLGDARGGTDG